jgi:ATP-binding protein involved in chromosome partitioning
MNVISQQTATGDEAKSTDNKMSRIKHKILVLSGKGGVGKSTLSVNLAAGFNASGFKVGLLDVDLHGPSIPQMLNLTTRQVTIQKGAISPFEINGIRVMPIGPLLPDRNDAVIWRGPMKIKMIRELLQSVDWGELDYLIIDCPPGTGDEPLSVIQMIPNSDGCIIVTTPQEVALADVRRSITFCRKLNLPILGVVENMSGFICPHCGERTDIFSSGGGERMAEEMKDPFLARIPIDSRIVQACDSGTPYIQAFSESHLAAVIKSLIQKLLM